MRTIAIFRRELRLDDNPLLQDAEQGELIPVFFLDQYNQQEHGDNLRALFFHALRELQKGIEALGGRLYIVSLEQQEQFFDIARPDEVRFCEDVEPHSLERDEQLKRLLERKGIRYRVLRDSLLSPIPESTYPSFTQFYKRHFSLHVEPETPIPPPSRLHTPALDLPTVAIPDVDTEPARGWYATEQDVQAKWRHFVLHTLSRYSSLRNLPSVQGVSRMSPYIRRYVPELQGATTEQLSDLTSLHRNFPGYPPPLVAPEDGRKRFLEVAQRFFGESAQEKLPLDHE